MKKKNQITGINGVVAVPNLTTILISPPPTSRIQLPAIAWVTCCTVSIPYLFSVILLLFFSQDLILYTHAQTMRAHANIQNFNDHYKINYWKKLIIGPTYIPTRNLILVKTRSHKMSYLIWGPLRLETRVELFLNFKRHLRPLCPQLK